MREKYLAELKRRAKESHVYRKYQLMGLEIAQILGDEKHKSLYIKLAKNGNPDRLMAIAKDVADRSGIKNKGAYFMAVIKEESKLMKPASPKEIIKLPAKTKSKPKTK